MRRIAKTPLARMAVAAALTAWLAACGPTPTQQYTDALDAWKQRQYATAYSGAREAQSAAQQANDTELRDKAAYLSGLAAFQLGRMDDAGRAFATAAKSSDRELSGRAKAMMAGVAVDQGRWSDASDLYADAATLLKGAEADRARSLSQEAASRAAAGKARVTRTPSDDSATGKITASPPPRPPVRTTDADSAAVGSFTIVAGTYGSEVAARQRATLLADQARRAGVGSPRVVPSSAPRGRVWLVEVGVFSDRAKAQAALKKLPISDGIVAPTQQR